jgi:signal transduction histidine kinase/FixJ family two-component response regulator
MSGTTELNPKPAENTRNFPCYAYMCLVIALGLTALAIDIYRLFHMDAGCQWLILAAAAGLTSLYCIAIPTVNSKISIGDSLFFANLILFGIPAGVITQAVDSLCASCRAKTRSRRLRYILFNVAATSLSAHISGSIFFYMMKQGPLAQEPVKIFSTLFVPLGILAITHYLFNSGSVSLIVALEKRKNFLVVWKDSFLWTSATYFIGAAAAGFIALNFGMAEPQMLFIIAVVLLVVYFTYKTYLDKVAELHKLKMNLEEEVKQRTRELEEATQRAVSLADAAEAASRAKSDFLATMSHEIRTPLNAVIGYSEMLQEDAVDLGYPQLVPDIQKISSAGRHLLNLICDILDFSKIEAGMLKLNIVRFDLHQAVEELAQLYAGPAHRKGLHLICQIDDLVPRFVMGDPDRLCQVLTNLVGNAIKFTQQGEVAIHISVESIDEMISLRFEVRDTGIGVPVDAQSRIFQEFSQADGSTARKYGGTGLGLAIVKRLVEMMNGEVGIHSEPGKGSNFWFTVSFRRIQNQLTALSTYVRFEDARILIVDDNESNRELICHQLTSWRMESISATNGAHALELAHQYAELGKPFDLALFDMNMPGINGVELAKIFKKDALISNIPLILLNSGDPIEKKMVQTAGFYACLNRPVVKTQLNSYIAQIFLSKRPETKPLSRENNAGSLAAANPA